MSHLSHLTLDGLRLGTLRPDQREAAEEHLGSCERCETLRAALDEDAARFAERFDTVGLAVRTLEAARPRRPRWRLLLARTVAAAAAAAAVALVVFWVRPWPGAGTRVKGGAAALELFAVRDAGLVPLRDAPVRPDAVLRLRYDSGGRRHVRFLWSGPDGELDPLHPALEAPALDLGPEPDGPRWLKREIRLHGPPGTESLHAVYCADPVDHPTAAALVGGAPAPGCTALHVELRKTP